MDFVHLHAHTSLGSMLDALNDVGKLFEKVKALGQSSLAITDHGTMAAHYDAFQASQKTGVKFIPGCEMYFVNTYNIIEEKGKKTERRKHLVLLAQNHIGYKNLLRANYIGFENQVQVMGRIFPRINWDVLEKHNEGLICLTACANGPISTLINNDKQDEAEEVLLRLHSIFKDRLYLEIQPHHLKDDNIDQRKINEGLIEMGQKFGVPLVVATDTHYLTREDEKYHDVLMAINSKKPVDDPDRHRYGIDDFYVKTGEEVYDFLERHYGDVVAKEAVENTIKIANICDAPDYVMQKKNHLPIFDPKGEEDYAEFLEWYGKLKKPLSEDKAFMRFRCIKGFKKKFSKLPEADRKLRWERVKKEVKVLEGNNFSSYMLIVSDFIKWAKKNSITVGQGRGCTSRDTLVLTEDGFKKINEVKLGEIVYSHTGELKEVENVFEYDVNKNEKCLSIKTDFSFGELVFTKDHKLFVERKSETKEYLNAINNKNKYKRYNDIENKPNWVRVDEIDCGDFIFLPWPKREKEYKVNYFDLTKYMEKDCYFDNDGLICKNIPKNNEIAIRKICKETGLDRGTVQRIKRGRSYTERVNEILSNYLNKFNETIDSWINSKNYDILKTEPIILLDEEFAYILGRWIGDGWLINNDNGQYGIGIAFNSEDDIEGIAQIEKFFIEKGYHVSTRYAKNKNLAQVYIYGKLIYSFFRDLFKDYQYTSNTKYIGEFKYLPENLLKHLLYGLKDSDGSDKDGNREAIDSTSIRLIYDVREALLYLKIPSGIYERKEYVHNNGNYLCNTSYKIRFTGLHKEKSLIVKKREFDNGFFTQVESIKEVDMDKVYDIQVKDNSSYLTQNYASHNSCGGCLTAYLLDVHSVDPIEYDLLFERFQNAYKKDLPDIDTDFSSSGRDKVREYCKSKYGAENCAQISNLMTYSPKSVIPSLVKSMRNVMPGLIKEGENHVKVSEAIKAAIPEFYEDSNGEKKKVKTLEKAMELSPELVKFSNRCPELMDYAKNIVGLASTFSSHAAALIIADQPIVTIAPVRIDKDGIVSVQYEKNRCEALGLVKMDLLSLSTLDVIDETIRNIKRLDPDAKINSIDDIPLNDENTYKMIQDGGTRCVFQLGKSTMMVQLCKSLKPKNILDIALVNALGRPSSSKEERKEFMDRRFGRKPITYLHPSLEKALKQTYGLGIFEEQLLFVAQDVAGWDLNKADGLRKLTKLKGKDPELAGKLEADFIEGAMKVQSMSYEQALEIWEKIILPFAKYGFNKCLVEETEVIASSGVALQIKEIKEQLEKGPVFLKSYDYKSNLVVDDECIEVIDAGEQDVYKITISNGKTIECTKEHKFLCVDGKMHTVREIIDFDLELQEIYKEKEILLKIISCEKIGKKQVYNLSMKGDNHNYILTSGVVSANSHAIFYSINSYLTAYLKCNYPVAFFAAYLKNKTNDNSLNSEDEIATAKSECKEAGIKIIPPDVNRSGISYEVLDKDTIVMGLMAIKGMGEKAVEEIIKKQPFCSFKEFLYKTEARVVNKTKIEVLAKAGCFDSFGLSRKAVFEEGKKIKDKMNAFIKKNGDLDLDAFPIELSKEEWSKSELLGFENEVLGELVSGTIKELFPGFFTHTAIQFSKLKILPDRENIVTEFIVKSILREFAIKTGKYTGQKMIKYRVEDVMGNESELTVWPTEYDKAKKFLKEEVPVRAECQISEFNGQKTLMLREIRKVWNTEKDS